MLRSVRPLVEGRDVHSLAVLGGYANGPSTYAFWKEKARALAVYEDKKMAQMIRYTHNNPVRQGLVEEPGQWLYSSFLFYKHGAEGILPVASTVVSEGATRR